MDLSELQVAHDSAAEAIGAFEADWASVETEWSEKRRAVNDAYREAFAALEAAKREESTAAAQSIEPEGVVSDATSGQVG